MNRSIVLFLLALLSCSSLYSQTMSAGVDDTICLGESARLSGSVYGNEYLYYHWKSDPSLSDTMLLSPWVCPDTTTTYTLYAFRPDSTNLVTNGDFSAGNTSFTSQYNYKAPSGDRTLWNEGTYTIAASGNDVHENFGSHYDHTVGTSAGKFLIVNGSMTQNTIVWSQVLPNVTPNTDYVFYAWCISMIAENPALLQFSINGVLLDVPFQLSGALTWDQFYTIWNSGSNTTATITIVAQFMSSNAGNDFGIDDIFFTPIYPDIDSATVHVGEHVEEEIAVALCNEDSYSFGGMELTVSGVYTDTLQTALGCDSVVILQLTIADPLILDLGADVTVCKETSPTVTLSSPSGDHTYAWSTGGTSSAITVDESGVYYLTIANTEGCIAVDSISVTFIATPEIAIVNHTENFCDNYSAELEIVTDVTDIVWSTGETDHTIRVEHPGTYRVVAQREMCKAVAFHVIEECDFNLYFPTAISPGNGDGLNDYFALSDPESVASAKICIYNRYGELIFYSEDPYFKWDGTHRNKPCPVGTYSYGIHVVAKLGKSYYFKGLFLLM
ncbi:MAG: gliding motility-associated C-terminal domain-containing protein [Bacteroidales bacterium]|jgi:gliding motility-associated-like protein|nr:gliding motility-associated C-terminal domain-containing protein [Bacteroidales bacterium]